MTTGNSTFKAASAPTPRLNRLRFTLLVLIGVYPLITAISYAVGPLTAGWQVWERTLVVTPIMAPVMVYGLIPFIQTRFRGWLMR